MGFFYKFFATGAGTGYISVAPGTFGAAVGVLLWWGLSGLPQFIFVPTVIAFIFFSVWVSNGAQRLFGGEDPQKITIDEVAGMLVTVVFHQFCWVTAIAGFVLFRIFDIAKPFPIRRFEKLPGGWGIVLDDVLAGVYANICLWGVMWVLPMIGLVKG
jgi:phosphatidylglycerophosphatase A